MIIHALFIWEASIYSLSSPYNELQAIKGHFGYIPSMSSAITHEAVPISGAENTFKAISLLKTKKWNPYSTVAESVIWTSQ